MLSWRLCSIALNIAITQLTDMFVEPFVLHHIISEASHLFHQCCSLSAELYLALSEHANQFLPLYELQTDPILQDTDWARWVYA